MNKNVRFQGEPPPDYDDPEADYDDPPVDYDDPPVDYDESDGEPAPDYDDAQTVSTNAVIPQIAARRAGNLRQISRSAETEHDLSVMENLNEVSILRVLEERFNHDVIQTYIGDVLIVINPYKKLDLYGERYHEMYKFVNQRADLEPHIYWTVDHAYRRMTDSATNQVILISGESGAGKTESTKLVVKHLTHICQSTMTNLHERIVKVNPLLEAFGNAQTVMNHNSSRFGKFVELAFNGNGQMKGACIHDYLLEKSRVVHLGPQERNFHIFYYMFAGMPEETLRYYYLEDPMAHRILKSDHNQKGVFYGEADRERCSQMFKEMEKIMNKVAFTENDIATIYTCLAAILFITNVEFQPEDDEDGVVIIDDYPINIVADLLAIDVEKLTTSLISKTDIVRNEEVIALKTLEQANDERDAIAKALYSRLFGWIVRQVNTNLMDTSQGSLSGSNSIGILDLSGFENFADNSFEQLCINVANEKLQYFFNTFIFATEQAIYAEEGIDWSQIEFRNNEDILRLFLGEEGVGQTGQKKMAFGRQPDMFTIVDDESKTPRSSDSSLVLNWRKNVGSHPNFTAVDGDELAFVIMHFADKVLYNASNFLEKNRDRLGNNLMSVLQKSENGFIKDLFMAELTDTGVLSRTKSKIRGSTRMAFGKGIKNRGGGSVSGDTVRRLKNRGKHMMPGMGVQTRVQTTVSQHFRKSLEELMKKMNAAQPLFVRCIKPNKYQEPDKFTEKFVQRQLQYSGVLQIATIARLGFPVRMAFGNFYKRFALIFPQRTALPSGDMCGKALQAVGFTKEDFAIGKTKVFMKEDVADRLRLATVERAALTAQRAIRGFVTRKRYQALKEEEARKQREIEKRKREEAKRKEQEARMREQDARERDRKDAEETPKRKAPDVPAVVETVYEHPDGQPMRPPSDDLSVIPEILDEEEQISSAAGPDDPGSEVTPFQDGGTQDQQINDDELFTDDISDSDTDEELEDMNWDIAQLVPVDRVSPSETFDSFVKAMRVLFYIFLFIVILVSGSFSIVSLLWLERLAGHNQIGVENRKFYLSQLLWIIWIPHVWSFVTSVMKTVFGHMLWPPARMFFVVLTIETLQSFGLAVLVFGVLPKVPALYAVGLLTCVASVPAFLQILLPRTHQTRSTVVLAKWAASLLALLVQLGAIVYLYVFYILKHRDEAEIRHLYWQLPVSVTLMSLKWWENYVPRQKRNANTTSVSARLFQFKKQLHTFRTKLNTVMSMWNIIFSLAALWLIQWVEKDPITWNVFTVPQNNNNTGNLSTGSNLTDSSPDKIITFEISVLLTQIISSWVCYYFSALACKLLMQRVSFCTPLALAFPVAAAMIQLSCKYPSFMDGLFTENMFEGQCDASYKTAIGVVWWLSLLWICGHVWYPRSERLAKTEKLFVTRLFTGPLVVQSMLLNRRYDDAEVKVSITGKQDMSDTYTLATTLTGETIMREEKMKRSSTTPIIYACATMWHENKLEMIQLLKSVFRMDADQSARRLAREVFKHDDPDYYDFEAHVFFDDAMELDDDEERVVNGFVKLLVTCMDEAASSVQESEVAMPQPVLMPTPYGGRLTWNLPGNTIFVAHLKDKSKIRHLKRWSQVMYMYYLLGYKLFGEKEGEMMNKLASRNKNRSADHVGKSEIFQNMEEELLNQAENTFLLALDGDVDFKPEAVRLLVDRMRKNYKTGAACGRIHPIGSGPMVWYQVFEYAVGHWFQKSTEHVLGCVLCSPGCFSLFRGSALLDDNVMKRYTTRPLAAQEFLQYDQGEDRWLCTLLLQQGYRVDYTAASDALTYAPEGFNEFFNQRRRWTPSTMANIIDLLSSAGNTVRMNDNISWLYMFYQGGLMGATVLGPATVILAIATAFETVLKIQKWEGYVMSLMPVVFQLIISFTTKKNTQLLVCAFLSTFYACVMTVVAVGIMKGMVSDGILDPSLIFLTVMTGSFVLAGIMHPYEFTCLLYGIIYYLCIPSGYLVLIIFAFSNLQDISWGTRDVPKKKTKAQLAEEKKRDEEKQKKKKRGWFSFLNFDSLLKEVRETTKSIFSNRTEDSTQVEMLKTLRYIRKDMKKINRQLAGDGARPDSDSDSETENEAKREAKQDPVEQPEEPQEVAIPEPEMADYHRELYEEDTDNPAWINKWDGEKEVDYLDISEAQFWRQLIKKYLKPIKKDAKFEKKISTELIELRNNVSFAYWLINGLWILFNFMIQSTEGLKDAEIMGRKTQPLGFIFMVLFMIALFLQFIGMLMHRWGTFLQLIAITELSSPFQKKQSEQPGAGPMKRGLTVKQAVQVMSELQKGRSVFDAPEEPPVDYSDEEEGEMMPQTPSTPSGASGGDVRGANGDVGVRRRARRLESITNDGMTQTIRDRVIERRRIDTDLQFQEQTYDEVGEDMSNDQTFKRPGGYDWQHRFTTNTISRAMTRRVQRRRVDQEPEDRRDPTEKARQNGRYKKNPDTSEGREKHKKQRHRRDRSNSQGRSEEKSHRHHHHHGRHRRHRRRTDVGPNTHVIQGGELETHLIRRLDRWRTRDGGHEVSHF